MNFSRRASRPRALAVDMTPMIDIVFQLLIFFLTTARMADMARAEIDLPLEAGERRSVEEAAGLIVNLPADGSIVVSGRAVGLDELESIAADVLRERTGEGLQPLVRADRNADAALLNEVLRRLQRAGFAAARIGTSPPSGGGGGGG